MRTCTKCNIEKDETEYYTKGTRLQSMCKSCFNKYCMERLTNKKIEAVKRFGGICHDCKNEYPHPVFEFHHLDPSQKDYQWVKLRLRSTTEIIKELDKCVMLCANCHRMRHYPLN